MEPKIITDFKEATKQYFASPEEQDQFINTPEHWWGAPNKAPHIARTCYQYLTKSRNKTRLEYAINTTIQLKTSIIVPSNG